MGSSQSAYPPDDDEIVPGSPTQKYRKGALVDVPSPDWGFVDVGALARQAADEEERAAALRGESEYDRRKARHARRRAKRLRRIAETAAAFQEQVTDRDTGRVNVAALNRLKSQQKQLQDMLAAEVENSRRVRKSLSSPSATSRLQLAKSPRSRVTWVDTPGHLAGSSVANGREGGSDSPRSSSRRHSLGQHSSSLLRSWNGSRELLAGAQASAFPLALVVSASPSKGQQPAASTLQANRPPPIQIPLSANSEAFASMPPPDPRRAESRQLDEGYHLNSDDDADTLSESTIASSVSTPRQGEGGGQDDSLSLSNDRFPAQAHAGRSPAPSAIPNTAAFIGGGQGSRIGNIAIPPIQPPLAALGRGPQQSNSLPALVRNDTSHLSVGNLWDIPSVSSPPSPVRPLSITGDRRSGGGFTSPVPEPYNVFDELAYSIQRAEEAREYSQVRELCNEALRSDPNFAPALEARARASHELGDMETAYCDADAAIRLGIRSCSIFIVRAIALLGLGSPDYAILDLDRAIEQEPARNQSNVHALRAYVLVQLNRIEEAILAYDRAIELAGPDAGLLLNRAHLLRASGRRVDADIEYSRVIDLDPKCADAYYARASVRKQLGGKDALAVDDYSNALELYEPQSSLSNDNSGEKRVVAPMDAWFQALFERADLRRNIGHYQRALADFNRLLHARPKHVPSLLGRADVHCKHLQPFQAVQDYSDVLAMNEKGEATPEQALEALKGRGEARLKIGDNGECRLAIEDFSRALESEPRNHEVLDLRGQAYAKLGRDQLALADFNRAIGLYNRYAPALNHRGLLVQRMGHLDLSKLDFASAIAYDSSPANAFMNRAHVNFQQGHRALAVADYHRSMAASAKANQSHPSMTNGAAMADLVLRMR